MKIHLLRNSTLKDHDQAKPSTGLKNIKAQKVITEPDIYVPKAGTMRIARAAPPLMVEMLSN